MTKIKKIGIKRLFSVILCVCILFSCVPVTAFAGDTYSYIDRVWNSETGRVDKSVKTLTGDYTVVDSTTKTWENGWYVVTGDVSVSSPTVKGTVYLLLCDGATLTAGTGIRLEKGNTLYIYAQSEDANNMGELIANGTIYGAGIGTHNSRSYEPGIACGNLIVNGGVITAKGGRDGTGIGGGSNSSGGAITVNGGLVTAMGGMNASGIGCNSTLFSDVTFSSGSLTVNGGSVTATAGQNNGAYPYAIGGTNDPQEKYKATGPTVTVNGGSLKAASIGGSDGVTTVKNAEGSVVTLKTYTLDGVKSQKEVSTVLGINYGGDFYTLDTNKLYLYLPEGENITGVTLASGQVFEPKTVGDTALYCAHAQSINNLCPDCGIYLKNGTEISEPSKNSDGVYLISSVNDLIWFSAYASFVNSSANAKLTADIDASKTAFEPIGTSEKPYGGTFDGNGFSVKTGLSGKQRTAMFAYAGNATVKNLTLHGDIAASDKYAASFIGESTGNTVLEKCLSDVTITSSVAGDGTHGGLVGVVSGGTLSIKNCGFYGAINGAQTTSCAGLVGWTSNGCKTIITDSFAAASFSENLSGNTLARNPGNVTVDNCYYLKELGDTPSGAAKLNADAFKTGEATYLLNNNTDSGVWKQTIGTDDYPNFKGENVFGGYLCGSGSTQRQYTNTEGLLIDSPSAEHIIENGVCKNCGSSEPAEWNETKSVYEIYNASQLYWFASLVNGSFVGLEQNASANAVLMNNITVNDGVAVNGKLASDTSDFKTWMPVGNNKANYCGTFDGNGYTISGLYLPEYNENYFGMFGIIGSEGTVKNLTVSDSYFKTDKENGGVFAGSLDGTIEKCAAVNCCVSGRGYIGGIVGIVSGGKIANCYVNGTVCSSAESVGGIAGFSQYGVDIQNCYFSGTYEGNPEKAAAITQIANNSDSDNAVVKNCYYETNTGFSVGVIDNNRGNVTDIVEVTKRRFKIGEITWLLNGGSSEGIFKQTLGEDDYPSFNGKTVYQNKGTCVSYTNGESLEDKEHGVYENGICKDCGEFLPAVLNNDGVYEISNLGQLLWFAEKVNGGNTAINGKLTADIDATSEDNIIIGTSSYPFGGTFDGGNFTLNVKIDSKMLYAAPFAYVKGATVKNLSVDGTITTNKKFAASIIGKVTGGTTTLENCISDVEIISNVSGDGTHGGLVGVVESGRINITNCGFSGAINGSSTHSCGGLVGWSSGTTVIKNSYVAADFGVGAENGYTFARGKNITVKNCCYLNANGTVESGATQKTAKEFKNGDAAYALNNSVNAGVWKQTLGKDIYPNFKGGDVYYGYAVCEDAEKSYSNTATKDTPEHDDAICILCSESWKYDRHEWKCPRCNKVLETEEHNWTYSVNDETDTVTRTCKDCGTTGSVKLSVEDKTYDGKLPTVTFEKTGNFENNNFNSDIEITYCCDGGCKNAGKHTVTMTIGEVNVSKEIIIAQKEITITIQGDYKEYDGTNTVGIIKAIMSGSIEGDSVYIDESVAKVYTDGVNAGEYTKGYATGIVLTQADAANYYVNCDENGRTEVTLQNEYTGAFRIYKSIVYITPLDQQLAANALLDQTKYTLEYFNEKFDLSGVELYEENGYIYVKTDNIKVFSGSTDVTDNFEFSANGSANLTRMCEGHTFNDDGFCSTGKCDTYEQPTLNNNGTSDTYDDYYEIRNAGQLYWFAKQVNDYGDTYINGKLMSDITVNSDPLAENARAWVPIGNNTYTYYSGNFDGNGYTVSGLYRKAMNSYVGFFGNLGYGTVKNITVANSYFEGYYAGGIAGYSGATVTKCAVLENVTVKGENAGGIIGNTGGYGTLANCYSLAAVSGSVWGGLVGQSYAEIENSYTTAMQPVGRDSGTFTNVYYGKDTRDYNGDGFVIQKPVYDGATEVTNTGDFYTGKIAYLLQQGVKGELLEYDDNGEPVYGEVTLVWGQTSSKDGAMPVLTSNEDYRVLPVKSGDATVNYSVLKKGETNGDGVVDVYDYQNAVNIALSDENGKETAEKYDLNKDGVVDVEDSIIAQRNNMSESDYNKLLEKVEEFEGMCYMKTADFDGDGVVDILDIALFEKLMSGHRVEVK